MIHFTQDGIYADIESERLDFYDRLSAGDPVLCGQVILWQRNQKEEC